MWRQREAERKFDRYNRPGLGQGKKRKNRGRARTQGSRGGLSILDMGLALGLCALHMSDDVAYCLGVLEDRRISGVTTTITRCMDWRLIQTGRLQSRHFI